ncbi:MAG TPA: FxLYD domain-containing protein [Candidatus Nitrosocosmicus sp.]|nr:FxLYD domain-containing protein [Candidatus Nitrosocosmicus sp.]
MQSEKDRIWWWMYACAIIVLPLLLTSSAILSFSQESGKLTSNSLRPEITILNMSEISVQNSTTGLTSVSGTIQNNSTANAENLKVNVTLYDSDNKTIRDTTRFVSGPFTIYEPNSTERFSFLMSVERFDHYKATAFGEQVPK